MAQYGAMSKMAACCAAASWPTARCKVSALFFAGFFFALLSLCVVTVLSVNEIKSKEQLRRGAANEAVTTLYVFCYPGFALASHHNRPSAFGRGG